MDRNMVNIDEHINIINKIGSCSEVFSLLKNQRLPYPEKIYI